MSSDLEVQERACSFLQLMTVVQKLRGKGVEGVGNEMALLFDGELNPVSLKAQKKVGDQDSPLVPSSTLSPILLLSFPLPPPTTLL